MSSKAGTPKQIENVLWAPWRMAYIEHCDESDVCIFCEKTGQNDDRKNLIVYRGAHVFVIMNLFPYNNGHLMIVPFRHTHEFHSFTNEEKVETFDLLAVSQKVLTDVMKPQGFNIGMNLGRVAGAGIEDHLHFHLVPRWSGDTNFMPILGHVKVVSEGLSETWKKLKKGFEKYIKP